MRRRRRRRSWRRKRWRKKGGLACSDGRMSGWRSSAPSAPVTGGHWCGCWFERDEFVLVDDAFYLVVTGGLSDWCFLSGMDTECNADALELFCTHIVLFKNWLFNFEFFQYWLCIGLVFNQCQSRFGKNNVCAELLEHNMLSSMLFIYLWCIFGFTSTILLHMRTFRKKRYCSFQNNMNIW